MSWYILIYSEFSTLNIDAVNYFLNSILDVESSRKINHAFGNDSIDERCVRR